MLIDPPVSGAAPPASLYLHFPFCVHRCHYCDFSVHRTSRAPVEEWLECIGIEVAQWFERVGWSRPVRLETVFVGGGTPSLIGGGMSHLASLLDGWFDRTTELEWTAESNPASLDVAVAGSWRRAGVNRLSVGIQSFDDRVLRWLGRLHDAAGARQALDAARAAGFEDVNADLIFGLPESVPRDWRAEVGRVLEAGVTHVSAYGLTAEPRTPLGRRVQTGEIRMVSEDRYAAEYLEAVEALGQAGFVHYEVSNFALPGRECRHNWHYWDGSPYLGLGPSAHGFVGGTRLWNVFRWEAYRRALADGQSALEGHEMLGAGESRLERLWLALRTNRGVAAGDPLLDRLVLSAADLLESWGDAGWVHRDEAGLRLTAEGWLRMDTLVAVLGGRMGQHESGEDPREGDGIRESDRA